MPDSVDNSPNESTTRVSYRRWVLILFLLAILSSVLWTVINPYRDQPYEEVPHGDHVHYVPKDRNEDVAMSRFPTRPPGENERITPDGEVVPANR